MRLIGRGEFALTVWAHPTRHAADCAAGQPPMIRRLGRSRVPARGWCSSEQGQRAVAQLGSALDWGSRGREFKSRQPDTIWPSESRFAWSVSGLADAAAVATAVTRLTTETPR